MYRIKLFNTPDTTWVDESRSCINLYALTDKSIRSGQVAFIRFNGFKYEFDKDVLAVPYVSRTMSETPVKLYYPKGFKLTNSGEIRITLDNKKGSDLFITKGQYLATLRLMTTQFYSLMSRNDGSDKGLRPAYIKIEFYDESTKTA